MGLSAALLSLTCAYQHSLTKADQHSLTAFLGLISSAIKPNMDLSAAPFSLT